ncbi:MAG: hypothetical protein HeimC3_18690 [Candidatus Heimdallarchaeota archaeon LC_3]|nr:MAG: hypothetical protein HeimC3_18690 [Candidatus Heimdallarchaeota archaeon LC_3]
MDTDNDGMPDWFELENGLNITRNDSYEDLDNDGIANIDEFEVGLNMSLDDSYEDLDNDGMPNLWEIKSGLDASFNDAGYDKDGDWIANYIEFRENTDPSNFWSVPIFYKEFPYICLSLLHLSIMGTFIAIVSSGTLTLILNNRKNLIKQLGAPDYTTARFMLKNGFKDFETFEKAQKLSISSLEEYEFTLELMELEKK